MSQYLWAVLVLAAFASALFGMWLDFRVAYAAADDEAVAARVES